MHMMKNAVCAGCGVVLSALAQLFGGWDAALGALLLFMAADYVTGHCDDTGFAKAVYKFC